MSYLFTVLVTLLVVAYVRGMWWAYQWSNTDLTMTVSRRRRVVALWPLLWLSLRFSNVQ